MSEFSIDQILHEEDVLYGEPSSIVRIELTRKGISKKSLYRVAEFCDLSLKDLVELLPVSLRTIQRYHDDDLLDTPITERIILIAEILEKGMEVFDSRDKLLAWLKTPVLALGQKSPLSLLDTVFGIRLVMDLLGRIEHGVYS